VLRAICFLLICGSASSTSAAEGKRVLIVHSFGSASPPFTTHSVAFETELTKRIGEKLDLDEVSLDHARYSDPELEQALVEYLQKRQTKWQPDLVVPIGSPAGIFVEKYRERCSINCCRSGTLSLMTTNREGRTLSQNFSLISAGAIQAREEAMRCRRRIPRHCESCLRTWPRY